MSEPIDDRLMTPAEVASIFRVNPKTVERWANAGLLTAVRPNPNGWRRYKESQVRNLLDMQDNGKNAEDNGELSCG